jgi:hypothetical protein
MMHRESADDYRGEIVRLGSWRVAECADGLQWLLQRQRGDRWRSESFCRSRSALIRLWQGATGDDGAALGNLPPLFALKPRVGTRLEPQVGFSRPSGSEKDMAPAAAFFGGAAQ